MSKPKALVVDDEQLVLNALVRTLSSLVDVRTATSGEDGLAVLANEPDIAIVMSDMHMLGMNGATFLAKAHALWPDTVRLLLTGQADTEDAILAVNEGSIFRFLCKPCPSDTLRVAVAAALEHHRLIRVERELLEQTLRGAVKALCDALALANPTVFGASTRVKQTVVQIAAKLGLTASWTLEVAAMMSQLGALTLPPGLYERRAKKVLLSASERGMLDRMSVFTDQLISPIPRLERVRAIIRHAESCEASKQYRAAQVVSTNAIDSEIALGGQILRLALDLEELTSDGGNNTAEALARLQSASDVYGERLVVALTSLFAVSDITVNDIPIAGLREGMVIAADVMSKSGVLIVARGHDVTESLIERLRNFAASLAKKTVQVIDVTAHNAE